MDLGIVRRGFRDVTGVTKAGVSATRMHAGGPMVGLLVHFDGNEYELSPEMAMRLHADMTTILDREGLKKRG